MLNIVKNYVNNDGQLTREIPITPGKCLDLLNLLLKNLRYSFDSQLYEQTDHASRAGPASSTTAEFYMQAHEETARYST